jgi:hypothetical protein
MNKLFRVVVMSSYCYEILNSLTNQSPPIGLVSNLKTWHPTGPATVKRFLPYWGAVNDLKFPKVWGAFVGFHQLFFMERVTEFAHYLLLGISVALHLLRVLCFFSLLF